MGPKAATKKPGQRRAVDSVSWDKLGEVGDLSIFEERTPTTSTYETEQMRHFGGRGSDLDKLIEKTRQTYGNARLPAGHMPPKNTWKEVTVRKDKHVPQLAQAVWQASIPAFNAMK